MVDGELMNLFLRRHELLPESNESLPEWDYSWGTADAVFPSQKGWAKTVSGNGAEAFSNSYYRMRASTSSDYIQYEWPDTYDTQEMWLSFRFNTNYSYWRVCLSDGEKALSIRVHYTSSYRGVYLYDSSSVSSCTKLASLSVQKTYNLWLDLQDGYGDVYLKNYTDGGSKTKIADHIDCSSLYLYPHAKTSLRYVGQGNSSSTQELLIYGIRMKQNRL